MPVTPHERLARLVSARLAEMGWDPDKITPALGKASQAAPQTWRKIIAAEPVTRRDSIWRMEDYLRWERGSFSGILSHSKFVPTQTRPELPEEWLSRIERKLDRLIEQLGEQGNPGSSRVAGPPSVGR